MKKFLSTLLAVTMMLAMFSGMVIFDTSADIVPVGVIYDRTKAFNDLDDLLTLADDLGMFNDTHPAYDTVSKADEILTDGSSSKELLEYEVDTVRILVAEEEEMEASLLASLKKCVYAWDYNYTDDSYYALRLAIDEAWDGYHDELEDAEAKKILDDAYAALKAKGIRIKTENMLAGWTGEAVNDVVTANSGKLCDNIGNSDNVKDVWDNGDFTNDTVFDANDDFTMVANADFTGKTMGWKNMDRSGTLATKANGGYPTIDTAGLAGCTGIRFKLDVDGSFERILIGISNCADISKEDYALRIRPENVDADGYINIPFDYFEKAWWNDNKFDSSDIENAIVLIFQAYNVENGTSVTISDMKGYLALNKPSEDDIADLDSALGYLKAFDVLGRYTALVQKAEALTTANYDADYQEITAEIMAILKAVGDPDAGIIDVPGFSIFTQEEMDKFTGYPDGGTYFTKTEKGMKQGRISGNTTDYAFAPAKVVNGTSTGYHENDCAYGQIEGPGGKTFKDMLGGYGLDEIYEYRFHVVGANLSDKNVKTAAVSYKDGAGLWNGMFTAKHIAVLDGDYLGFYVDTIDTSAQGGWYSTKFNTIELITKNANYAYFQLFETFWGKDICDWQVLLFKTVDRSALKTALVDYAGLGLSSYTAAADLYYSDKATEKQIGDMAAKLDTEAGIAAVAANLWQYNYTAASWSDFRAAYAKATTVAEAKTAKDLLVPAETKAVTGNLFDGWTTKAVNDVVTANSDKLCDSIGDGLNAKNVWNNGDFSNNTTFAADNNFSMTATAAFAGKSMGWKNMDRSGTLAGKANYGYPELNVTDLSKAEGIRFKLDVDGSAGRLLIGLSNCATMVREMYALNIKPEYVDADGYINIPFSYFVKAWWCDAFAQSELDKTLVFIVEAYDVTDATKITISDIKGYKEIIRPTSAELKDLNDAVAALKAIDLDGTKFATYYTLADDAIEVNEAADIKDATTAINGVVALYDGADRTALKTALNDLIEKDGDNYFATERADFINRYYATTLDATGATTLLGEINDCIKQFVTPDAPNAPLAKTITANSIELVAVDGVEYKCGEGEWQTSNKFTGLSSNTEYTFYIRYAAHGVTQASAASAPLTVTTDKGAIVGDVSVEGIFRLGETATASAVIDTQNALAFTWFVDGVQVATGAEYTFAAADVGKDFYVTVSCEDYIGVLTSEEYGPVGKGIVTVTEAPTASQLPITLPLKEAALTGGQTSVPGTWAFENPDFVPSLEQTGSEFTVIFTPDDADLYETATAKVVVDINVETEPREFSNTAGTVSISGDFHDLELEGFELVSIAPNTSAYYDLLRSVKNSTTSGNLIFMYDVDFGTAYRPYIGTLTLSALVGTDRAGQEYTVWLFADGDVVSAQGVVGADGFIVLQGLRI